MRNLLHMTFAIAIAGMTFMVPINAEAQETGASASNLRWGSAVLRQAPDWYGSEAAKAIADSVILYQSPQGGWPKSTDLATPPRTPDDIPKPGQGEANSLDNNAIALPIPFLARVASATGDDRYRQAVLRSIDYLVEAQYPNGGWPQFYPLRKGYYSRVTYNDNAMVSALIILRNAANGTPPYDFVDEARRDQAAAAVERGIDCILRSQIKQDGRLTVWCAQHDENTLEPAWARSYEPPSFSGSESVGIVRFLMEIEEPTPEIIAAVEGAVSWFREVAIQGVRVEDFRNAEGEADRREVADPDARPLWARFYELGTNRPIYLGRDSEVRYNFGEIERERRQGYRYHGNWAESLLDREYPRWREKHNLPEK